ncbi:MAG TPA: FAD-dependent oxidoreductase [Gammaproteobacteria bacterium]
MTRHLLIVGGGQAAVQAVHSLRQNGFDGRITVVGGERHAPYQRPPLSKKYLAGELPRERLALRPAQYYRDKGAVLELGVRAVELDADSRRVRLADGRVLGYDGLLLATGSVARRLPVPGAELRGVHYLRTIDDVDAISAELAPGRKLVLVGAGYIGLEVAAVAAARGVDVTVLEAADRVMSRVVSAEVSAFYARCHAEAGVKLRCRAAVSEFLGRERVEAVLTADGTRHPCDLAIVGVGVEPDTALARSAGLPCENGILVDEHARTADPLIAAAGDCTNHPHPLAAGRVRLESVQNAIEQAKAAASHFAGEAHAYTEVPWFWSDQFDLKLQIAGLAGGADETVVRGDPAARSFAVFHLRDGRLVAVEAVNRPREFLFAKKAVARRLEVAAGVLADPDADLAALVP